MKAVVRCGSSLHGCFRATFLIVCLHVGDAFMGAGDLGAPTFHTLHEFYALVRPVRTRTHSYASCTRCAPHARPARTHRTQLYAPVRYRTHRAHKWRPLSAADLHYTAVFVLHSKF